MRFALATTVLVFGCSRSSEGPIRAEPPTPTVVAPASVAKKRGSPDWSCTADSDCTISCAWGAVNKRWLSEKKPRECKDGCQEIARAVCDHGSCVAVDADRDGGVIKGCTHIECPPSYDEVDHCAQEFP
jgi:hypothetical protein